ncbi:Bacterial transcription activator, effector binding protein [Methanosarcina siciliae T4/M]|uniref:Bacterial transcription activator, effector binding protein n=1 Tax=Methanosarcina siciliae T4/M TaxID=1434120 RepID=A0A0E3L7P8_9EURY|nr:GyrI-like domain-containing protein [Methanosarcina siciliae]AKB27146.1 Bacterial transcription activator, effector binding protein [Methanosarcina siciliae T4/M]
MPEVTIVELSPQLVLGMRKTGAYREIPVMFQRICEFALSKNIPLATYPAFLCHEITVEEVQKADEEGNADIEVVFPIYEFVEITGDEEIKVYKLPGGKMAKIVHKGPYEECTLAYEKLFSWISENGKRITGPVREVYLNDPREVQPEEILTEIYAPLE